MHSTIRDINVATDSKFYDVFGDTVSARFNGNVGITAYATDGCTLSFTALSLAQFREIAAQVEYVAGRP